MTPAGSLRSVTGALDTLSGVLLSPSAAMAPTLYEYDAFGNMTRETLALAEQPAPDNSPIREYAFSVENAEDGVYLVTTQIRYNAQGEPLTSARNS